MNFNKETLELIEKKLLKKGYRKLNGHYKSADYAWWKSFEVTSYNDEEKEKHGYQIAFSIYDFSKYPRFEGDKPIGIQNEFLLGSNNIIDRLDLSVSDREMTIEQFEKMCAKFYKTICVGFIFKNSNKKN